jgi:hypothetical protein
MSSKEMEVEESELPTSTMKIVILDSLNDEEITQD